VCPERNREPDIRALAPSRNRHRTTDQCGLSTCLRWNPPPGAWPVAPGAPDPAVANTRLCGWHRGIPVGYPRRIWAWGGKRTKVMLDDPW